VIAGRSVSLLLIPASLLLAAAVWGFSGPVRFQSQKDEGVYLYYAVRVSREGPAVFPGLFAEYHRDEAVLKYYPSPLRLTTIGMDAAAVRMGGENFQSLQWLSLASFLALLAVLGWALVRVGEAEIAGWVVLLVAASPLLLGMARRALSDSLVSALMAGGLLLLTDTLLRGGNWKRWTAVALLYALAFLSKESGLLLIPISLALLAWWRFARGRSIGLGPVLAVSVLPLLGAALAVSAAAGGLGTAWETFRVTLGSAQTNAYALKYGSGPWLRYILDFLLLSPGPALLYLGWLGLLLGSGEGKEAEWMWAGVPVLFLVLSATSTKNVRYAMMLEIPVRLGAVFLLQRWSARIRRPWARAAVIVLPVTLLAALDLASFHDLFVRQEIYDPMTVVLMTARGLLPR